MVRHLLQGRLTQMNRLLPGPVRAVLAAPVRWLRRLLRWLIACLAQWTRAVRTTGTVSARVVRLLLRPADPNNLFTVTDTGSYDRPEGERTLELAPLVTGERRHTLLMQDGEIPASMPPDPLTMHTPPPARSLSLTRGSASLDLKRLEEVTRKVNHRFSLAELLHSEIKRLKTGEIRELTSLVQRLAKRWLDLDQEFEAVERRTRLDVPRTLRANLSRYGGHILDFKWATKDLPVPKLSKPARVLVIGDVSHSMYHYVTVALYFFHLLNFRFQVNSYVFSERATRSTEFLNGPGAFEDKVQDLVRHAASWNAGTRFGSSLETILAEAQVDAFTYVVIATDGKVALGHGEYEKIHREMARLQARAKMVVFLTPEASFAQSHGRAAQVHQVGAFKSGLLDIPIFDLGQIWYNTLGKYADRVYHVQTVQDLADMCEDLYLASRD